jgi:phosphate butyryltransferase
MIDIKHLDDLEKVLKGKRKKRVAVAYAQDPNTIMAVHKAVDEKLVDAILIGDESKIEALCKEKGISSSSFRIIHEPDEQKSGLKAVEMVHNGEADIVMKGLISTIYYMKAILHKEKGLLPKGSTLTHIAVLDIPTYDKLLIVSDVAIIPEPTLKQKIDMTNYCINAAHKLGIKNPKVAIIAANEKVSERMQPTLDAAVLSKMADRHQIKGAIVDGPLALDVALSKEACDIKGLKTPVEGFADILIFPSIETGNVFYKSTTILAKGSLAGIVVGAKAPVILTSRADSDDSKYYSILLGAILAEE